MPKQVPNTPKLNELINWELRPALDNMLDDGVSPYQCAKWIQLNGLSISIPTVYSYAKKRQEAILASISREGTGHYRHVDPVTKRFKKERDDAFPVKNIVTPRSRTKVKNDLELLDYVIQHGMDALQEEAAISPGLALKAIEIKHKIQAGSHQHITVYGFEEIKHRERAREEAILLVLKQYVPEDQWTSCLSDMEGATRSYYDSVGLGEKYEETTSLLS